MKILNYLSIVFLLFAGSGLAQTSSAGTNVVSIVGNDFYLNGRPTYEGRAWNGHRVEGLLLNNRVVQGTFDDLNPETVSRWAYPDTGKWDAERNNREFLAAMPEWKSQGLLAFTVNFQGGSPEGYSKSQPWINNPFNDDGSLRPAFMERMKRILDEADRLGMVPIVGYFYFGQSGRLKTDENCLKATDTLTKWLLDGGWRNVLVEINNESSPGYNPPILRPDRVHELIAQVRDTKASDGHRLLVGTSFPVKVMPTVDVVRASDFVILHGNGFPSGAALVEKVEATRALDPKRVIPVVINEDDHNDFNSPTGRLASCVAAHVSWGWFDWRRKGEGFDEGYQSVPVNWGVSSQRKRKFYNQIAEIAGVNSKTAAAGDWIELFDPNLSHWELFMGVPHTSVAGLPPGTSQADKPEDGKPLGLGNDPKHVFTMVEQDGQPVLRITGEIYGGLTSLDEYENFHFSAQVKWGEQQWPPRVGKQRDSGLLYHCTGPHGAFWNVWMRCVEFQVQERDFGDLFMLAGTGGDVPALLVRTNPAPSEAKYVFDPVQPLVGTGRVQRSANFEQPHGEWNTLEIFTLGRKAVHVVNGHVVMAIDNIRLRGGEPLSKGKIQIQSEGAEVYYRDVKIQPITDFPADIWKQSGLKPPVIQAAPK
jgi:hypothetical protein